MTKRSEFIEFRSILIISPVIVNRNRKLQIHNTTINYVEVESDFMNSELLSNEKMTLN